MKFKNLAWGAFLYSNSNRDTHGERIYNNLISDTEFLSRLQNNPNLDDFEKIRNFLVHFGVNWTPKNFAEKTLLPLWPTLKPHIGTLARETLDKVDLSNPRIKDAVMAVFDWPFWVWGGETVRSKVLHLFNINLFVMWDEKISLPYPVGAEGYFQFLEKMQIEAKEAMEDFNNRGSNASIECYISANLNYQPARSIAKLVDQYNWITTVRGWPCEPPDWLLGLFCE